MLATLLTKKTPVSKDLSVRLAPFLERGLIGGIPTTWQLLLGQLEMAPYVVLPDAGDKRRYDGAPLGHPLTRTPIVISQIGWEHFRVGHGLLSSPETLELHLAYVFHEGMPTFDLQLVQTHADGLGRLRTLLTEIETGSTARGRHHRRMIDLVIPRASDYRRQFLEDGGWIDRAARFDYPGPDETATFLRPEFTQLTTFIDYCLTQLPKSPREAPALEVAAQVFALATRRLREKGR
ncbi:MAG: hypothetical protein JNJ59_16205 [Deltaproteobacteria bacterium]|nr:hypothetical protein [Deltaproteobacteria bacterium]